MFGYFVRVDGVIYMCKWDYGKIYKWVYSCENY